MASLREMKSGVLVRSLFRCVSIHGLLAGAAVMFVSCAQRHATPTAQAAATGAQASASTGAADRVKLQKVSVRSTDAASDRIVSMVETARLAQSGDDFLIFVRAKNEAPTPSPSLYEDAVALGRLRSTLKTVPGIPESACHQATVRNGVAVIPIKDSLPATTIADIVDTALTVDVVRSVRINLPTAPR